LKTTNKMRINELARELEVKANVVLEILPDLGVTEKKTHSSSIDLDTAEKVRQRVRGQQEETQEPEAEPELPPPPPRVRPQPASGNQTSQAAPVRPRIPAGGGTPIRPPVQALRPPLKKPAPPPEDKTKRAEAEPQRPAAPGQPEPPRAAPGQPEPERPAAPATAPERPPLPGKPAAPAAEQREEEKRAEQPAAPQAPATPKEPAAPKEPQRPAAKQVKPIPSEPRPGGQQGPRAPLPGQPQKGGAPAAPVRPPMPGGKGKPGRPVVPPGSRQPQQDRQMAARQQRPSQAPSKPVLVPGKPIYERPKPSGPVPGMPVPTPGQRTRPAGRSVPIPGAPAPGPGPRPQDRRGRGPSRPARDREAEREERVLKQQASARARAAEVKAVNTEVTVSEGTTVKELAEKLGIKANYLIKALFERGAFATINQTLDVETIQQLCKKFGATAQEVTYEEETLQEVGQSEEPEQLLPRAPVVTVMGHVDHGKTSLLDAIRETNVADREAGGITQAIGAHEVEHNSRRIVFIDTPGHEAFTRMRARGAQATDVVILVVAADDGVMPQTKEAIDHARSAGVPIIVAINKIDKANADPERVKQQLADSGLLPEDWGGDTVVVPVSAVAKQNLDSLLEMVLLVSDLRELKANPARPAVGTVLESKLDRGKGPVATVLIQNGTLRKGDHFLVGSVFGRVRAMLNDRGQQVDEAGPSSAVRVMGLEGLPAPGDAFQVATDTEKARKISEYREEKAREQTLAKTSRLSLEQFQEKLRAGEVKELPVVLKADVQGSMEVLSDSLEKLSNEKVQVRLIHAGVGAISKPDVLLATAANAVIIGFNVRPERTAAALAEQENVDIRLHTIIYEVIDEIKKAMAGLLEPIIKETPLGRAEVRQTFRVSKVGTVAGCIVQDGRITRNSQARLLRDNVVVHTSRLSSLKRFKDDVSEVRHGQECGIALQNFNDIKEGDVIEAFVTEKIAQELPA